MTAPAIDATADALASYRANRARAAADNAVTCPKCNARFGDHCQSTGGGNGGPVITHKARTARIDGWSDEQRQQFGEQVLLYRRPDTRPSPEVVDRVAAEAEAAAKPLPAAKPKPVSAKSVRLSELQAEEIERFACNAGKGSVSTAHFHGDHQHRQTINALVGKGILAEGGLISHGYDREYTLTSFGWQVYLCHRLIIRSVAGDRWAASLASQEVAA